MVHLIKMDGNIQKKTKRKGYNNDDDINMDPI